MEIDNKRKVEDYYKAYEKRYRQVYEENNKWSSNERTPDVYNTIKMRNITKNKKILEVGCGEGRDAIPLLEEGYNLSAMDYSKSVIEKCNELSHNAFYDNFFQFDIMEDELKEKYDFIYSIAVLHMFVSEKHRKKFYTFIKEHLNRDGYALIGIMGNGACEYESNIKDAFDDVKRVVTNNKKEIKVAATSCKIINWTNFEKEIQDNGLKIENKWISKDVPDFTDVMFVIVK